MHPMRPSPRLWMIVTALVGIVAQRALADTELDLTGTWRGVTDDTPVEFHLVQDGTSLLIDGRPTTIDLETSRFSLSFFPEHNCPDPQFGLHGEVIDANHLRVYVGGYILFPNCRLFGGITHDLTLVAEPTATPTPTPTPSPSPTPKRCAGDCNRDGRVAVNEAQTLARCADDSIQLTVQQRCRNTCGADDNRNGLLEINELVRAVNNLLRGCP